MSGRGKNKPENKPEDDIQTIVKTSVLKLCNSEDFINQITQTIVNTLSENYEKRIKALEDENANIKSRLQTLEEMNKNIIAKYDKFDSALKRKSLRIYGLKETKDENCSKTTLDLITKKMEIKMESYNIESCYRVGKYDPNKVRPIYIKFVRLDNKREIFKNKKKLKGTGIVIREELTKEKLEIVKAALNLIGDEGNVWTDGGNVFGKIGEHVIRINSRKDLEKFRK